MASLHPNAPLPPPNSTPPISAETEKTAKETSDKESSGKGSGSIATPTGTRTVSTVPPEGTPQSGSLQPTFPEQTAKAKLERSVSQTEASKTPLGDTLASPILKSEGEQPAGLEKQSPSTVQQKLLLLEADVNQSKAEYENAKAIYEKTENPSLEMVHAVKSALTQYLDKFAILTTEYRVAGQLSAILNLINKHSFSQDDIENEMKTLTSEADKLMNERAGSLNTSIDALYTEFLRLKGECESSSDHKTFSKFLTAVLNLAQANYDQTEFMRTYVPEQYAKSWESLSKFGQDLNETASQFSQLKASFLPDDSDWKKKNGEYGIYYENLKTRTTTTEFPRSRLLEELGTLREKELPRLLAIRENLIAGKGDRIFSSLDQVDTEIDRLTEQILQTRNCIDAYDIRKLTVRTESSKEAYENAKAAHSNEKAALEEFIKNLNELISKHENTDQSYKINDLKETYGSPEILQNRLNILIADENFDSSELELQKATRAANKDLTLETASSQLQALKKHLLNLNNRINAYEKANQMEDAEKLKSFLLPTYEKRLETLTKTTNGLIAEEKDRLTSRLETAFKEYRSAKNEYDRAPNHASSSALQNSITAYLKANDILTIFFDENDFKKNIDSLSNQYKELSNLSETISKEKTSFLPDGSWFGKIAGKDEYYNKKTGEIIPDFPWYQLDSELQGLSSKLDELEEEQFQIERHEIVGDLEQISGRIKALEEQIKQTRASLDSHPRPPPPPRDLRPPPSAFDVGG